MKKLMAILLALSLLPFSYMSVGAARWGDADNDGRLTAADVATVLQNVLSNGEYMAIADVDGNNKVNSTDAAIILQKVLDSSYIMPVEENEPTSEETTQSTTEEPTTEITTAITTEEPTTEITTAITTEEPTTEETTQLTTEEPTTETTTIITSEETSTETTTYISGVITSDYELTPSMLADNEYFTEDGDFTASNAERIRLTGSNKLSFTVAEGANLFITAKHASNTTEGTRTLTLTNSAGSYVASKGYEMGVDAQEYLYAAKLNGAYVLSSDNHINILSIRITFDDVEPITETTTAVLEVPTEITTTGNVVEVSNFSELNSALSKTNVDIYVMNDIDCSARVRLSNSGANVNIIGITQPDGTAPSLNFAKLRDSMTSTGSSGTGIYISGSGYSFKNLIVENAGDCGMRITGSGASHVFIKDCIFRYNNNSGISVTNGGHDNTFIGIDSYRNGDIVNKCGDDADGFSVKLTAGTNNYFYNCRAFENSDDGWDSYDRGTPYIGDIYYIECLAWNNGNPEVFTGEYDYNHGYPMDKGLLYIQAVLADNPDFETEYNNRTVTQWPQATIHLYGKTRTYEQLHSDLWGGNPNGFKFGSAETPNTSYRYIENCIAFDHAANIHQPVAKGYDQNNGSANYDIINGLSFDNVQNYWMGKMTALSQQGIAIGFGGELADELNNLNVTTPDEAAQQQLREAVHSYKNSIYDKVYNDIIPGIQLCDVFS